MMANVRRFHMLAIVFLVLSVILAGCEEDDSKTKTEEPVEPEGETYTWDFEDGTLPSEFSSYGFQLWSASNTDSYSGSYSLQSGPITHAQDTCVDLTPSFATAHIKFRYFVSSEDGWDWLAFYIDGATAATGWSGAWNWDVYAASPTDGLAIHTYTWCYDKDGAASVGQDVARIDELTVSSLAP